MTVETSGDRPADGPLVLGILYPAEWYGSSEGFAEEVEALEALDPRVEVVVVPYEEPHQLRTAKSSGAPSPPGAAAPPIGSDLRNALARLEVAVAIDLPGGIAALAPRLRWVQAVGAGTGQLDIHQLAASGIRLTANGGANGVGIAEFVVGRLLGWAKRFDEIDALQPEHRWEPVYGSELSGRTLGLLGYGGINRRVATRAAAFDMRVIALRRSPGLPAAPPVEEFLGPEALDELLARSDAVVAAVPETPETIDLFDDRAFAAMRRGAYFVNVGRGTLVDEAALRRALESGHLAGAAIDVARREPLPADDPLWEAPRLHISAHCSSSPGALFVHLHEVVRANLSRYLDGQPLLHEVRPDRGY